MRFTLAILAVALLCACKPPAPPAPTPQPAKPLLIIVPGLGNPDTAALTAALTADFPGVNVVTFATGQNSYLADVKTYVLSTPHTGLITVGFSYGTDKVNQIISDLGPVLLDVKLDPVPEQLFGTYTITPNVGRTVVVTGDFSGLFRAAIDGKYDEFKIHTSHTQIPSDPRTVAIVEDAVRIAL